MAKIARDGGATQYVDDADGAVPADEYAAHSADQGNEVTLVGPGAPDLADQGTEYAQRVAHEGDDEQEPATVPDAPEGTNEQGAQEDEGDGTDQDGDGVPDGSAQSVLTWVTEAPGTEGDTQPDRARRALAAEQSRPGGPRKRLADDLQRVVDSESTGA